MARASMRELFRFRNSILTSKTNLSSPFYSSCASSDATGTSPSLFQRSFALLEACQNMRQLFQIQAHFITCGLFHNPFWAGKVLHFSSDFGGDIDYTLLVFRYIHSPDRLCINTVIKAYSKSCVPYQAVVFYFEWLRNGFLPNSYTFVPLVGSCAKMGCVKSGLECHGQAIKNGVDSVIPVQNSLIHMYGCCGDIELANKVFVAMSKRDLISWNSIVDGYARIGNLGVAHQLFDLMPERNVVSWNIMINGYLKGGNPGCGLKLFREMVKTGLRGSDTTMVGVLTTCGHSARLKEGRSAHGFLIKMFLRPTIIIDTALIDMYSRCKRVDVAFEVFKRMANRNLVCWNAMILGHCLHGNPEDGLTLFGEMLGRTRSKPVETNLGKHLRPDKVEEGIIPDEITFIGVLCACSHVGFVDEGRHLFESMNQTWGISPKIEHYGCMVDLLSRAGFLDEAHRLIKTMPIKPNDVVWGALLGGCRTYKNAELASHVAQKLVVELDPDQAAGYLVLLSHVYAIAKRWQNVIAVRQKMVEMGVRKPPGRSWVQINGVVHDFVVGDSAHKHAPLIYEMLGVITRQAQQEDYKLDVVDAFLDAEE